MVPHRAANLDRRKCLEKKPKDRYSDAGALADDLHLYLKGDPIKARAIGLLGRVWRWCRKEPVLAGLSAAVVILLVSFAIGGPIVAYRESRNAREQAELRSQAEAAHAKAEERRQQADRESRRAYRSYYHSQMSLAQRDWEVAAIDSLLGRLEGTCPEATGGDDLRGFEWYYWRHRVQVPLQTLRSQWKPMIGNPVVHLRFDPDGRRLALGTQEGTVKLWDVVTGRAWDPSTGQELGRFTEEAIRAPVTRLPAFPISICFSRDTRRFARVLREVEVCDRDTGEQLLAIKDTVGRATGLGLGPDGDRIAVADYSGSVRLWDIATGEQLLSLDAQTVGGSMCFSLNGKQLASASSDRSIKVWDLATGKAVWTLGGHAGRVEQMCFSPDGGQLASGGSDRRIKVWDLATGEEWLTLSGHTGTVNSVCFSPDGERLASGSSDRRVKVWDLAEGESLFTLQRHSGPVRSVCYNANGTRLATSSDDSTVNVWDAVTGGQPVTIKAVSSLVGVCFGPDGAWVASGTWNGSAKVWDTATGRELVTLKGYGSGIRSVICLSPDSTKIACASGDGVNGVRIKVWDTATWQEQLECKGHTSLITSMHFGPDSRRLASGSMDGAVRVWDLATGKEIQTLRTGNFGSTVHSVCYSADGRWLASAADRVEIWDAKTGKKEFDLRGQWLSVKSVCFSPDSKRLASASDDKTIKLWGIDGRKELLTLQGHTNRVESVCFSPDGSRLASGSFDQDVKVWDATTGEELLTLEGHRGSVNGVCFSVTGKRLASASDDRTIMIWDAREVTESLRIEREAVGLGQFLFDHQGLTPETAVDWLQGCQTISDRVREKALELTRGGRH